MPVRLGKFREDLMNEFGLEEDNNNAGTSVEAVTSYIDKAHSNFINKRSWRFNIKLFTTYFVKDTFLENDISSFGPLTTSIVLDDTSTWPSTGIVVIDGDIVNYTANDGVNTLTCLSTEFDRTHLAGESVTFLHEMPSDFSRMAQLTIDDQLFLPEDLREDFEPSQGTYWQHIIVDSNGICKTYLQLPNNQAQRKVLLKYTKNPVDLTIQDADTYYLDVPIPSYYDYVKYSVFSRLYDHLEEQDMSLKYFKRAEIELKSSVAFDSKQHSSLRVPIRSVWDNPKNILYRS